MTNTKTLGFLPNLCVSRSLLHIFLAAIALAFVLALASAENFSSFFIKLGLTTIFVVWTAIMSALIICMFRRLLSRLNPLNSSIAMISIIAIITLIASVLGLAIMSYSSAEIQYWDTLFILKNLILAAVITALGLRYFYVQHEWEKHVQSDSEAKYSALQSRMRPHFLFNSLNTIAMLTTKDPEQAEEALLDLADIFRSTLDKRDRVSLEEELDVTTRYLRIEGLRLGKRRLSVVWDMDRNSLPFHMDIPPLLLQPLVENAIYHGIQPRKDGGTLGISLYDAGEYLDISVSNPVPPEGTTAHSKGNHIAQENLKNRLQLAYGDRAKLSIKKSGHQYRVAFRIPKE